MSGFDPGSSSFPGDTGPSSFPAGLELTWSAEVSVEDILAAANRRARYLAGEDIPGRPDRRAGSRGRAVVPGDASPSPDASGSPPDAVAAGGAADLLTPAEEDPLGEGALEAALSGAGSSVPLAELAGHAVIDPGPALAGWLSCASQTDLDDAGLVTSIAAWRKVTSWAQARELTAVAELARRRSGGAGAASCQDPAQKLEAEFAPSEVALALTLTQSGAEYWMGLAVSMTRRLPATLAALSAGRVDLARAKLIQTFTTCLDDDLAGQVERMVIDKAEYQTTGQLRASLQRAVIIADPAAAERRREEAERNARVEVSGDPEGTGSLAGRFLPAGHAAAAWSRICAMAKAMQSAGAGGGIDLLRAQVFIGLLLGTLPIIPPPIDRPGDGSPDASDDTPGRGPGNGDGPGPVDSDGDDPGPGDGDGPGPGDGDDPGPGDGDGPGEGIPDPGPPGWRARAGPAGTSGPENPLSPASRAGPESSESTESTEKNPASPAWPGIPEAGTIPAPGCAPAWPEGIPPPEAVEGETRAGGKPAVRSFLAGAMTLTVPLRTLAGCSDEPGWLGRLGAVTGMVAREIAAAAAGNAACEWRVIVTSTSGEAIAVTRLDQRIKARVRACAAVGTGRDGDCGPRWVARVTLTVRAADVAAGALPRPERPVGPDWPERPVGPGYPERPAAPAMLTAMLDAALAAGAKAVRRAAAERANADSTIADGTVSETPTACPGSGDVRSPGSVGRPASCGHSGAVSGYRIPDSMRRLIEVRDQTCRYPICRIPASRTDMDHTIPYDQGGPTCRCNVSGECRHHHRLKHLKGWRLSQPRPGFLIWVTPARLTYAVEPDPYPA